MPETFYQCCYTNASRTVDGRVSSGWQAVCVSPDLPPGAYKSCVALLNAGSAIQSSMVDEHGEILNQYQLVADSDYLYLARTQYGLLDRLGRPNLFAHAFVFPLRESGLFVDPNPFLCVDRANFHDSEQAAAEIPAALVQTPHWDLAAAMEAAGLDARRYQILVRCVYLQMTERKAKRPLYIRYDGTDRALSAILYCIWCALPFALRRQLRAVTATVNDVSAFNLVFTEFADRHDYYVDPATGGNTALTPRAQRRIERLGFVDYLPDHVSEDNGADPAAFFESLERKAVELGDPAAGSELILKIACGMLRGAADDPQHLDDAALDGRLSDALRTRSAGSEAMERYIADLLGEVYRRRLILTDECEASLADWLDRPAAAGSPLAAAGERYNIYRFSTLSIPEAAAKLAEMPAAVFAAFSRKLAGEAGGPEILDHHYATRCAEESADWEALAGVWRESAYLSARPETRAAIRDSAWKRYRRELGEPGRAVEAHRRYAELMNLIEGPRGESDSRAAKLYYWERADFAGLSLDAIEEYRYFSVGESEPCRIFSSFIKLGHLLAEDGERAFLLGLGEFARRYLPTLGEPAIREAVQGMLRSIERADGDLARWADLVVSTAPHELIAALLDVRQAVWEGAFERFLDLYRAVRTLAADHDQPALAKGSSTALCQLCLEVDTPAAPVPLDCWLAIGAVGFDNPFAVFDDAAPAICSLEPAGAVRGSALLQKPSFLAAGEAYARSKSERARVVRRWLAEWRQAEKRREAESRGPRSAAGLGDLLDRGKSLFARAGRDAPTPQPDALDAADASEGTGSAAPQPDPADNDQAQTAPADNPPDPDAGKWSGFFKGR